MRFRLQLFHALFGGSLGYVQRRGRCYAYPKSTGWLLCPWEPADTWQTKLDAQPDYSCYHIYIYYLVLLFYSVVVEYYVIFCVCLVCLANATLLYRTKGGMLNCSSCISFLLVAGSCKKKIKRLERLSVVTVVVADRALPYALLQNNLLFVQKKWSQGTDGSLYLEGFVT